MTDTPANPESDEAAAAWFARLQGSVISQSDLRALRAWRAEPRNNEAFRRQEALWRAAARLRGDVDIERAVRRALSGKTRWRAHWGAPAAGAALAGLALAVAIWSNASTTRVYTTPIGEQRIIALADGSTVRLDVDSRLRVHFTGSRRALTLDRGRALFDVAHDAARPFVVQAAQARVTAVGTRFDVRRLSDARAQVVLLQGRVDVSSVAAPSPKTWKLVAGQELADTSRAAPPRSADLDAAVGWTVGELVFRDTPITEALSEANRYATRPLVLVDDPALADVRIDGVFKAGDALALGHALGALYDLSVEDSGRGPLVLRRRAASPIQKPAA